jgi:hypothetical protein
MELSGRIDVQKSTSVTEALQVETVAKMRKEIDVWKCCDLILKCLALGAVEEAVRMCNILYKENTLDPIKDNFTDAKSRKINETIQVVSNFKRTFIKK